MKTNILGISFCTRIVGLAVLDSTSLIHSSVKLYKEKWSSAKMESILTSLTSAIKDYNISHIVLSIPPVFFNREPFDALWQEIVFRFRDLGIEVTSYRLEELQQLVGTDERMSRKNLMNVLSVDYPELAFYARIERRNKNKYYYKMFEAAGVVLLHQRLQNNISKTDEA
jgi:RNase H-fold protein (predicted Holliday junction resolvase)